MADPINSGPKANTCGEVTSSDCVAWAGPSLLGVTICKGSSLTDVIVNVNNSVNGSTAFCYTGNWVDFSSSIPASGSATGFTYIINSFGAPTAPGTLSGYNPQYKWTKDGDLKLRGRFNISIVASSQETFASIALTTISSTCFPSGFLSQTAITNAFFDTAASQQILKSGAAYVTLDSTGILYINILFVDIALGSFNFVFDMGGVTFNIA